MEWFIKTVEWLKGKKTYFLSFGAMLTAIGIYLSGDITLMEMVEAIWAAILAMTIRAGVSKSGK